MPIFLIIIIIVMIIFFPTLSFILAGGIGSLLIMGIPIFLAILLIAYVILKLLVTFFDYQENKPLRESHKAEKENRQRGIVTDKQFMEVWEYSRVYGLGTCTTFIHMSKKQKRTVLSKLIEKEPTNYQFKNIKI